MTARRKKVPFSAGMMGDPVAIAYSAADLADASIIGAAHAARLGIKGGRWTAEQAKAVGEALVQQFGESIRPRLNTILREAERYYQERVEQGLGGRAAMEQAAGLAQRRIGRAEADRNRPGYDASLLVRKPTAGAQKAAGAKPAEVPVPTPNPPDMGQDTGQAQQTAQAGQQGQQTEEERRQKGAKGAAPAVPSASSAASPPASPSTAPPVETPSADGPSAVRRIRMEDIEQTAAELGRPLPDRKEYRDTWDAAKERAMANYATITRNLESADPRKVGALSQEETIVANVNLRRLTDSEIPELARKIEEAEAKGDTEAIALLNGKLNEAYDHADKYAQIAHKAGSEAGRRLALQRTFLDGPFDAATLVKKARAAAGGKLSKEATITVTRLAEKGKRVQQNIDARYKAKADAALKQMEEGAWSKLDAEKIRGCL